MSRSTSPPLRQRLAACAILCGATLIGTWPVFSRPWRALYDPAPGVALDLARFVSGDVDQAASARNPPGRVNALDLIARSDTLLSVWTLAWGAHALATAPARFYDANTLFPTPRALTYSDHQLGVLPWFAPTYWLTDNPVLAYQLALFLSAVT